MEAVGHIGIVETEAAAEVASGRDVAKRRTKKTAPAQRSKWEENRC
jgi:hypothetical protein